MTTEWTAGLPYSSVEERVAGKMARVELQMAFFIHHLLEDRCGAHLDMERPQSVEQQQSFVALPLTSVVHSVDALCAELSRSWKMTLVASPGWRTVLDLIRAVLHSARYAERYTERVHAEITALTRAHQLRARAAEDDTERSRLSPRALLKVSSFNVNFAFGRRADDVSTQSVLRSVRRAVDEEQCDVLCFQETHKWWAALLDKELLATHKHVLHHLDNSGAGGLSCYSKHDVRFVNMIDTHKEVDGSLFPAAQYELTWNETKITLYNVHLRPPVHLNGSSGPFSMLETSPIRVQEVALIVEHMPTRQPAILLGDCNENDGMMALEHLTQKAGFDDALGLTDQYTHWWRLNSNYMVHKRLDHILFANGLTAVRCKVFDEEFGKGSDHFLVLATFCIAK